MTNRKVYSDTTTCMSWAVCGPGYVNYMERHRRTKGCYSRRVDDNRNLGTWYQGPNGTANETPVFLKDVLQHELQGWVYQQATDGWAMNTYPRSMGELTGKNDPLFDSSVSTGAVNLDVLITDTRASGAIGFGYSQGATVVTQWLRDHANGRFQCSGCG